MKKEMNIEEAKAVCYKKIIASAREICDIDSKGFKVPVLFLTILNLALTSYLKDEQIVLDGKFHKK